MVVESCLCDITGLTSVSVLLGSYSCPFVFLNDCEDVTGLLIYSRLCF